MTPILLCPVNEHPVGPLHPDSRLLNSQPPLLLTHSTPLCQETKEVQVDTGGEVQSGAAGPDNKANTGEDANEGLTWEDYGLTPPAPKGFILNNSLDYVPFNIHLPSGELNPAKYIKIEWGKDPLIYGMINSDPYQYVKSFQATPMPTAGPLHTYTSSQLNSLRRSTISIQK